jgi:hypothetical protein
MLLKRKKKFIEEIFKLQKKEALKKNIKNKKVWFKINLIKKIYFRSF